MPKTAAYTLAWSAVHQAYTLYDHHAELNLTLDVGSPTWREWLEQTASFAFRGQRGTYTARREQIKPGDWYWYAYQRSQKRVRKQYLGKSEALSLQRLEEVAERFNNGQTVEDEAATSVVSARTHTTAKLRASHGYREKGMLAEAVAHARTAEDWESIASIAEEAGTELISRGETQMVIAWVAMLPRPLVFSRLRLFLFECWFRWYSGHATVVVEMVREYVQQHALPDLEIEDVATLEQAIVTHVDALYPRPHWSHEQRANRIAETLALYGVLTMQRPDGAAFSQAVCRRAVVHVAGLAYRARIVQHMGTVSILRGDLTEATVALEEALASAIADSSATWVSSIGYRLGMLYEMMGRLRDVTRASPRRFSSWHQAKRSSLTAQRTSYSAASSMNGVIWKQQNVISN